MHALAAYAAEAAGKFPWKQWMSAASCGAETSKLKVGKMSGSGLGDRVT
jgi:hypothetical protein